MYYQSGSQSWNSWKYLFVTLKGGSKSRTKVQTKSILEVKLTFGLFKIIGQNSTECIISGKDETKWETILKKEKKKNKQTYRKKNYVESNDTPMIKLDNHIEKTGSGAQVKTTIGKLP